MQIDPAMPSGGVALDWRPLANETSLAGQTYPFSVIYQLVVGGQTITLPSPTFTVTAYDWGYAEDTIEDEPSISRHAERRRIDLTPTPWAHPGNPEGLLALRHLDPTPVGYRTYRLDQRNEALLRQIEELENGDYVTLITDPDNDLGIVPRVDGMLIGWAYDIDFTHRDPPYKTIWYQGSGLPADLRVKRYSRSHARNGERGLRRRVQRTALC